MRTSEIFIVMSALAANGLACATRTAAEATEVPAEPKGGSGAEASCRHELGRCGGHAPGDDSCRSMTAAPSPTSGVSLAPLEDVVLESGKFAEINLEMASGSSTEVTFEAAGGLLEWNVHSHDGDEVVIHAEGSGTDGKIRFAAPHAGMFSYLWKNAGTAPVRLTTRIASNGSVRVHSTHPAP